MTCRSFVSWGWITTLHQLISTTLAACHFGSYSHFPEAGSCLTTEGMFSSYPCPCGSCWWLLSRARHPGDGSCWAGLAPTGCSSLPSVLWRRLDVNLQALSTSVILNFKCYYKLLLFHSGTINIPVPPGMFHSSLSEGHPPAHKYPSDMDPGAPL